MGAFPNPETQFKKGTSGNPNGRPKKPLQCALEAELEAKPELVRELVQTGLRKALEGDFRYWSAIFDRIDGKVPMPHDVSFSESPLPALERINPYTAEELAEITKVLHDAGFSMVEPGAGSQAVQDDESA